MKKSSIHSMQDARHLAKKRLPSMIFDYVDGVALEADGYHSNAEYLKALKLSQNVLVGGGSKKISKRILGKSYDLPNIRLEIFLEPPPTRTFCDNLRAFKYSAFEW